jgi:hypothetical protein
MRTELSEEQIRDALSRAEEIHLRSSLQNENDPAIESVLQAAAEMGLPRDAMLQALRERLDKPMATPEPGDMVFAKSVDKNFYVATVVDAVPGRVRVRFVSGGEETLSEVDLKPCNFMPGMKVVVQWPVWGWGKADVISYDAKKGRITASDGWSEKKVKLSEIRLEPAKVKKANTRARLYWMLIGFGVVLGGPLGALITWLLMR